MMKNIESMSLDLNSVVTNRDKFNEIFSKEDRLGDVEVRFSDKYHDGRYYSYISASKPIIIICASKDWWYAEYKEVANG
jgi:hypothetical protein